MQEESKVEAENKKYDKGIFADEIITLLNGGIKEASLSPEVQDIRKKQIIVLNKLSPNIVQELVGHLKDLGVSQSTPYSYVSAVLVGEVFERLVEIEDEVFRLDTRDGVVEQTEQQKALGELILAVMANPKRFGLDFIQLKNPDMVKLYFEKNDLSNGENLVIDGSLEVKKRFDDKTLKQLRVFSQNLKQTLEHIRSLDDAEKHGLAILKEKSFNISVSPEHKTTLVIPRYANTLKMMDDGMTQESKTELQSMIDENKTVGVSHSLFTAKELKKIKDYFMIKVQNEIKAESDETIAELTSK